MSILITRSRTWAFYFVPKSMTLCDHERRNGHYFVLFYRKSLGQLRQSDGRQTHTLSDKQCSLKHLGFEMTYGDIRGGHQQRVH